MSRRVCSFVRSLAPAVLALVWLAAPAAAQTTVVLDAPDSEVVDTTIRAGSYANTTLEYEPLVTRASGTADYLRRALLKFDTENTIPQGATIQSAYLTLTIKYANPETRTVTAYRIGSGWDEWAATWNARRSGLAWGTSGGDLSGAYASATSPTAVGSQVTLNITRLVQEVVQGNYGSRYTRVALVDDGYSTSNSYREYYTSEAGESVRPRLTVVYGSASASAPAPTITNTTTSTTSSSTSATLKVLQWNTHHGGIGTDGRYDPDRLASWIANMAPHIVSLNEVDDEAKAYGLVSLVSSKTGVSWSYHYDGRGNLAMTRLSLTNESVCLVNSGVGRKATQIGTVVNGRAINFWSAHLDDASGSARLSETYALKDCEQSWAEARIAAGDFNMQAGSSEYNSMVATHADAWLVATSLGTASNYSGNCDGCTRNSRIDYVFASKGATFLTLKAAAMIDTRDSNGYMPSDHKPLLVTYTVR
jgi:endonuclease/exonuclease/phosphatase family metal-dependent hydrolase